VIAVASSVAVEYPPCIETVGWTRPDGCAAATGRHSSVEEPDVITVVVHVVRRPHCYPEAGAIEIGWRTTNEPE
jgi:hypothetical protein